MVTCFAPGGCLDAGQEQIIDVRHHKPKDWKGQTTRDVQLFELHLEILPIDVDFSAQHHFTSSRHLQVHESYLDELLRLVHI